jgi:cobalt/nickel transport system permease protein
MEALPNAAVAGRRLLAAFAWVCVIALWPMRLWPWQAVSAVLLVALTARRRLPLRPLLRRAWVVWLLAALMGLGWIGQSDWTLRLGNLLLKSTLSLGALGVLLHGLSVQDLAVGLRWLRVPPLLTQPLAFWGRYYAVVAAEWQRLQLARRARSFSTNRRLKFQVLANSLGLLFIRAYERGEKVHHAMLARGYRD